MCFSHTHLEALAVLFEAMAALAVAALLVAHSLLVGSIPLDLACEGLQPQQLISWMMCTA